MKYPQHGSWPKVTVIIVNWNGERFLGRCLSALYSQTVMPHEVILVDNASSDNSLEIIEKFPQVRLLKQSDNLGFARGNNLAIKNSSLDAEWIALLNPDAFVAPDWLAALLLAAHDHPDFDIFASKLLCAGNPQFLDGMGDSYSISGRVRRIGHNELSSNFSEEETEVFSACAAAAMYRRGALVNSGGFDEDFFCYTEDVDLGFRMRLFGSRCLYIPQSVAYHVGSGTTDGQHGNFATYHGHRNLVWVFVKNMPGILFWLFLPMHIIMNIYAILLLCLRGQGLVAVRAKLDALLGLPKMWKKRNQVQKIRTASIAEVWLMLEKNIFK